MPVVRPNQPPDEPPWQSELNRIAGLSLVAVSVLMLLVLALGLVTIRQQAQINAFERGGQDVSDTAHTELTAMERDCVLLNFSIRMLSNSPPYPVQGCVRLLEGWVEQGALPGGSEVETR